MPPRKESQPKKEIGRPNGYKAEYVKTALKLYDKGWTDEEVADFFEISVRTLYRWQVSNPDFCQAIKMGKDAPDDRTERSLYHRANGFEWYEEQPFKLKEVRWEDGNRVESERIEIVKVLKRIPPDPTSAIFWLKNRRKEAWRDKHEVETTQNVNVTVTHVRDQLSRKLGRLAAAGEAPSLAEQPVAGRA